MTAFDNSLRNFLDGTLDLAGLKLAIQASIAADPHAREHIREVLVQLYRSGRLPQPLMMELNNVLGGGATGPQRGTPAQDDPDRTRITGGIPPARGPGVAAAAPEDADRTRISPPAHPPDDATVTRVMPRPPQPPAAPHATDADRTRITAVPAPGAGAGPVTGNRPPVTDPDATVSVTTGIPARTQPTGSTSRSGTTGSGWTDAFDADAVSQPLAPGMVIKGRFVLDAIVGRGGMGLVFKARDLRKEEAQDRNPYVAVKVLSEEFKRHPESLKALQREARKAQNLAHPNIVNVFDFDRDGGNVYMTMEYLEGTPLDQYIKREVTQGLPFKNAAPMIRDMAQALSYAHAKGIVHSDFKPGNAFLTNDGVVKVFDFGIARAAKQAEHEQGETTLFDAGTLGALTPAYASVEMLEGQDPHPSDDIYALACVAYELLTGRHPFNKVPANKARDQKLAPAPIKGITRRQFRGLLKGLAFERGKRTQSVDRFLMDIQRRRIGRGAMLGGGVAAAALAALGALLVPQYFQERRIERLVDDLKSGDAAAVQAALDRLEELPGADRTTVTLAARDEIQAFFERQIEYHIDSAQGRYNYREAERLYALARELYPDSAKIDAITQSVDNRKNQQLNDINTRFNAYLAAGQLLDDGSADNVPALLRILAQIDPAHPLLADPRLPGAYAQAAAARYEAADIDLAGRLVAAGLERFDADPTLVNLRDKIEAELERQRQARLVAQLAAEIESRLPGLRALGDFDALRQTILDLRGLAPDQPVLAALRQRLEGLLREAQKTAIGQADWTTAVNTLKQYADLIEPTFMQTLRAELTSAQQANQERLDRILAELNSAVADKRLDSPPQRNALALLDSLKQNGAEARAIEQAQASIAQGYLTLAREARARGDWEQARGKVNQGLGFADGLPVQESLPAEIAEIARAETFQQQTLADAERARLEQEKAKRIEELQRAFSAAIADPGLDTAAARKALGMLDQLAAIDPAQPLVTEGRVQLAERLKTVAEGLGAQGKWDDAMALSRDSLQVLPDSKLLVEAQVRMEQGYKAQLLDNLQSEIDTRKARIDGLLRDAKYTPAWEKELAAELKGVEVRLTAGDPYVAQTRGRIATLYLDQSARMREVKRFSEAAGLLERGRQFAPDVTAFAAEAQALAAAEAAFEVENREKSRLARIEGLKQTLTTQAKANNVRDANKTLAELRETIPDDAFTKDQAPLLIADAYLRLAESAAKRGQFDAAIKLAQAGLETAPGQAALQSAQQRFARELRIDAVRKSLTGTERLNTQAATEALAGLKAEYAEDYAAIRAQLADALAWHIDQVAAKNFAAAEKLLADARSVFPGERRLADLKLTPPSAAAAPVEPAYAPASPAPAPETAAAPAAAPAQDAAGAATATAAKPRPGGGQCSEQLAGYGSKSRAVCYDYVSDADRGPALVVIPAGGGVARPFAITKHEVSVKEYNLYCQASGECRPVGGSANLPVTGISYKSAQQYAAWLSRTTGFAYRIPSEQEWTYAANANGKQPDRDFNCQVRLGDSLVKGQSLIDVRTGQPNGWGLVNYVGNAQEWVSNGGGVVARGGAYSDSLATCDIGLSKSHSGQADEATGFRLVRSLEGSS